MLDTPTIETLAERLDASNAGRETYRRLPHGRDGASLDDAYRVQRAYQARLAARQGAVAGWKIALTSTAMQSLVGVDEPLAGAVYAANVHASGAHVKLGAHQHLGVEFEVAVWLDAELAPGGAPHDRASVAGAVGGCASAFELIEDRHADYADIDAFNLVAENCWNAGVVLAAPDEAWREVDLEHAVTRLLVDGQPAGEGRAGDALGHPLEAVAWLANLLNARGESLPRGTFVMTGSSITTRFPDAGQHYRFEVDGLGAVEAEFLT